MICTIRSWFKTTILTLTSDVALKWWWQPSHPQTSQSFFSFLLFFIKSFHLFIHVVLTSAPFPFASSALVRTTCLKKTRPSFTNWFDARKGGKLQEADKKMAVRHTRALDTAVRWRSTIKIGKQKQKKTNSGRFNLSSANNWNQLTSTEKEKVKHLSFGVKKKPERSDACPNDPLYDPVACLHFSQLKQDKWKRQSSTLTPIFLCFFGGDLFS